MFTCKASPNRSYFLIKKIFKFLVVIIRRDLKMSVRGFNDLRGDLICLWYIFGLCEEFNFSKVQIVMVDKRLCYLDCQECYSYWHFFFVRCVSHVGSFGYNIWSIYTDSGISVYIRNLFWNEQWHNVGKRQEVNPSYIQTIYI